MLTGKVKATAVLTNPQGVWEEEFPVEYPEGQQVKPLMHVANMLSGGLLRSLGQTELEIIPLTRVVSINIKLEENRIDVTGKMPQPSPHAGKGRIF